MNYKDYIMGCKGHVLGEPKKNMVVDITHGVSISGVINEIVASTEPGRNVVVLVAGDENKNQLDAEGIEYHNMVGNVFIYEETEERQVSKVNGILPFQHHDVVVVVGINFIPFEIIQDIGMLHAGPLIYIGDSYLVDYYSGGAVIEMLNNHDIQYTNVDRMHGYSQELVFLTNRLRKGVNDEIKTQKHRSYNFIDDYDKDTLFSTMLNFDIFICARNMIGEYTRKIREEMFDYDSIPREGESLVVYEAYYFRNEISKKTMYVPYGTILKILKVDTANKMYGYVTCLVETSAGVEFAVHVSLKFIEDTLEEVNDYPAVGIKAFYAYCVPPQVVIDKAFDRVMVEYKPLLVNNKRYLYSIGRVSKKNITVYFDKEDAYLQ